MNSEASSPVIDQEAVVRLECPACSGGLNLRRKHLGIRGKCVHCNVPITAVEQGDSIILKRTEEVDAAAKAMESAALQPSPVAEPKPAPLPDPRPLSSPEVSKADPAPASGWGFPQREESLPAAEVEMLATVPDPPALPSLDKLEDPAPAEELSSMFQISEPAPTPSFGDLATDLSSFEEPAAPSVPETPATPEGPPSFGFSDDAFAGPALDSVKPVETPKEEPLSAADLFDSGSDASVAGLFSSGSAVESGWGAKVPSQNHASISPFSTGSAEPEEKPGFAEALFREKAKEDTGQIQPKSPFGDLTDDEPSMTGGALFGATQATPKKEEPKEEVILDGDGRPLRPLTPEEQEQFGKELMHFGEYHKRSPWIKRIVKFVMTIAILGGIGYAAYVFLPEEQVEVAKAKVIDWLEPGAVLMDYLPFDIGTSEDGEKTVKIKALDGLDNLSNQMDSYLSTAEEQLNETLPEGAEGYKREAPVDMPEMPKIPKLPFNLGGAEEAAPAE